MIFSLQCSLLNSLEYKTYKKDVVPHAGFGHGCSHLWRWNGGRVTAKIALDIFARFSQADALVLCADRRQCKGFDALRQSRRWCEVGSESRSRARSHRLRGGQCSGRCHSCKRSWRSGERGSRGGKEKKTRPRLGPKDHSHTLFLQKLPSSWPCYVLICDVCAERKLNK